MALASMAKLLAGRSPSLDGAWIFSPRFSTDAHARHYPLALLHRFRSSPAFAKATLMARAGAQRHAQVPAVAVVTALGHVRRGCAGAD